VTLTSNLCLDKHVASVCATCFYWLCQLRRVRRSLDAESAATLVHAFVTSRMDYCNTILAGESPVYHREAPASTACCRSRRQRHAEVRQTADSAISCTTSCTGWTFLGGSEQAVCNGPSQHKAQQYMMDCCIHMSDVARRQHLRSAGCHQLFVYTATSAFDVRAFSVAGPVALVTRLPERSVITSL